ncbi:hypothetical protein V2J09_014003 [Rumex salicifolius]
MGGGEHGHGEAPHGDFRAKVWSMPGGPHCRPKHWKRNTAIAMLGVFLVCIPIAMKSAELEIKNVYHELIVSLLILKNKKYVNDTWMKILRFELFGLKNSHSHTPGPDVPSAS